MREVFSSLQKRKNYFLFLAAGFLFAAGLRVVHLPQHLAADFRVAAFFFFTAGFRAGAFFFFATMGERIKKYAFILPSFL